MIVVNKLTIDNSLDRRVQVGDVFVGGYYSRVYVVHCVDSPDEYRLLNIEGNKYYGCDNLYGLTVSDVLQNVLYDGEHWSYYPKDTVKITVEVK